MFQELPLAAGYPAAIFVAAELRSGFRLRAQTPAKRLNLRVTRWNNRSWDTPTLTVVLPE
jgi:hypothetical protein